MTKGVVLPFFLLDLPIFRLQSGPPGGEFVHLGPEPLGGGQGYGVQAFQLPCRSLEQDDLALMPSEEFLLVPGLAVLVIQGTELAIGGSVLVYSVGIAAAGMAAVFVLVWFLSGRMIRPIAESYRKQRRFITDAGHEIKTPITIIDADLEILRMETGDNEWVQDIQTQTARLAALTNDLICLSKMEEEEVQAKRIEFPLSDAVRETAESFQTLAKTRGRFTMP